MGFYFPYHGRKGSNWMQQVTLFSTNCVPAGCDFSSSGRSWYLKTITLQCYVRIIIQDKEFISKTLNFSIIREGGRERAEFQEALVCLHFMDLRNKVTLFLAKANFLQQRESHFSTPLSWIHFCLCLVLDICSSVTVAT